MKLDVLALVAHPDDAELGAGGTIAKLIKQGKSVGIIDLTEGELGSRGSVEIRYNEAETSSKILGIAYRENLKLGDGFFEETQENILKIIIKIRQLQPQIILTNATTDRHPDHGRAAQLVSRASYLSGLVKINTTHQGKSQDKHRPQAVYHFIQDRYIKPHFAINITEELETKMKAILAYKSQFFDPSSSEPQTPISGQEFLDFVRARAIEFGRPCGFLYAEGFTTERLMGVEDLFSLS